MTPASRLTVFQGPPDSGKRSRLIEEYRALSRAERGRAVFITPSDGARRELEALLRDGPSPGPPVWTLARLPREAMRACGVEPPGALNEEERRIAIASLIRRRSGDSAVLRRWASSATSAAADVAALVGLLQRHQVSPEEFRGWSEDGGSEALKAAAVVYDDYIRFLTERNLADFDRRNAIALDLLSRCRPKSLPDFIFLDNGQEIDALQARLLGALAGPEGRIKASVDIHQRTQMYRGAVPDAAAALAAATGAVPHIVPLGEQDGVDDILAGERRLDALGERFPPPNFVFGATREDQYDRVAGALREMNGTTAVLARSNVVAGEWREALAARGFAVEDHAPAVAFVGRFLRDALTVLSEDDGTDPDLTARRRAAALRLLDLKGDDTKLERHNRKARGVPPAMDSFLAQIPEMESVARKVHRLALWSGWVRRPHARAARAYGRAMEALARRDEIAALAGNAGLTAADALGDIESLVRSGTAPEERSVRPTPDADVSGDAEAEVRTDAAIEVLTVHSAVGRRWDNVVLVELEDGRFPQHAAASPWFSPADAETVSSRLSAKTGAAVSLGRFERSEKVTVEEERRLFLTAMSRGRHTTLSCHLAEEDCEKAPSPYLLALFGAHPLRAPDGARPGCYLQGFLKEGADPVRCGVCGRGPCEAGGEEGGPVLERTAVETEPRDVPAGPPAVPETTLSATALNEWFKCPRRYLLARVLRLDDSETDALAAGNLVHNAMEIFHRGGEWTPERLEACVEQAAACESIATAFSSDAALRMAVSRAKAAGAEYLKRRSYDGVTIVSEERRERVNLGGHAFSAKMDVVFQHGDGALEVVDYKTGLPKTRSELKKVQPQVNVDGGVSLPEKDDADVQMALYAVAKRGKRLTGVTHEYVYLRKPPESQQVTLDVTEGPPGANTTGFTTGDLDALEAFFADAAASVKSQQHFRPAPRLGECGSFRYPCPFVDVCDREEARDDRV